MNEFIRWLLNVEQIPREESLAGLRLGWEHPLPPWLWAVLVLLAALLALWSYSRLAGRSAGRTVLAVVRLCILLLVIVILAGPMLELPRETVEQDWVLVLADRSKSMTIADVTTTTYAEPLAPGSAGGATANQPRISRDEQLRQAIANHAEVWSALDEQRHVVWLGFHDGAFALETSKPQNIETSTTPTTTQSVADGDVDVLTFRRLDVSLGRADGRRTNIEGALEQALQRAAARPVSGIVLLSDGRADAQISASLRGRLQAERIGVFAVPLGSPDPIGDVAIRRIEAPRRAFVRDKVPVIVEVDRLGEAARKLGGVIKLVDQFTGRELDRVDLPAGAGGGSTEDRYTLTAEPNLAGQATWTVMIETAGGQPDLVPDNNTRPMQIELIDRPLRVLYVEGYPRWEYRYVKNLVVREESIDSSVMLLSADRDFAQEGNQPISRLPRSAEEFAMFDVIVLGDVPANFFSPQQLQLIRDHVSQRGAGLLWIAGERWTPSSYVGTALADLLPMRGSLKLPAIGVPVTMKPTAQAQRLGVLQLAMGDEVGWPNELIDPNTGWSQLYYAQRIEPGQLKPAVEVLAETAAQFSGASLPLVLNMRYGAGQSMYVATDEIWRWRYGRGELLPDQFWVQMIRMLGRESLAGSGDPATLEVNPRRVPVNQPVRIELRLLDPQLVQIGGGNGGGAGGMGGQRQTVRVALETEAGQAIAEIELRLVEGSDDRFAATYLPDVVGQLRARVDDRTFPELDLTAPVEVFAPDDELRRPETDHALLQSLASSTGGRVIMPDELDELLRVLPKREVRTVNPLTEPIWDSPLALILALMLLTGEWIGRKVMRLV